MTFKKFFFYVMPKSQATKAKLNKLDWFKVKSFCRAIDTINKMKRQPWNGRKYLLTVYWIKGSYSIYSSYNFIAKQNKGTPISLILKWAEEPKMHFSKDIPMAYSFIKRCSMPLINMVMHTETTMRYFTPVRMAVSKLYTWS